MNRSHEGKETLESCKGHTSHNFNPWFAIDRGDAEEEHGSVWFRRALAWSGQLAHHDRAGRPYRQCVWWAATTISISSTRLKPGETLATRQTFTPAIPPMAMRRRVAPASRFRARRDCAGGKGIANPARSVQLLGSDDVQRERVWPDRSRGKGREARRRVVRDG